jgi:hypothetical protein
MPNRDPLPTPTPDTPRGPIATPGIPDRTQEKPILPPIIEPEDDLNPNDPVLPVVNPSGGGAIVV